MSRIESAQMEIKFFISTVASIFTVTFEHPQVQLIRQNIVILGIIVHLFSRYAINIYLLAVIDETKVSIFWSDDSPFSAHNTRNWVCFQLLTPVSNLIVVANLQIDPYL